MSTHSPMTIRLASFNIQMFGEKKSSTRMRDGVDASRVTQVRSIVADRGRDTDPLQPLECGRGRPIRTGDRMARLDEDLCDRTHARAADADQVHVPRDGQVEVDGHSGVALSHTARPRPRCVRPRLRGAGFWLRPPSLERVTGR